MALQAWMRCILHVRVHIYESVGVCTCQRWRDCVTHGDGAHAAAPSLPRGEHGSSLLFLLLFQITVCFINAMVIWLPLPLWSFCLPKLEQSQRRPIDLSNSRDPVPLSQILPCQSFMNAAGGKWSLGNCIRQYA